MNHFQDLAPFRNAGAAMGRRLLMDRYVREARLIAAFSAKGPYSVSNLALSSSCSRNTRRCTLPVLVMGRASMNSISFGYS